MTENEIASEVIHAAIDIHRELGPGLLEASESPIPRQCKIVSPRSREDREADTEFEFFFLRVFAPSR